jgi:putative ABC transport system permease protein
MEDLWKDVEYGIRTLTKNRAFAALAIVTLGLGIGANTAIFSVISGVLLKPLPYASGDRLVLVRQSAPLAGRSDTGVSVKELYDYREQANDFDNLVEYHQMNFDLLNRGEPDRVNTGVVSHDFFNVLGIAPILGRTFVADDDRPGADAVLVLSYSYWQQKFGGDAKIVGQVFQMNDRPHTVVGVLPNVPLYPQENDVYMSVSACPFRAAAEKQLVQNRRAFSILTVFGHLKPGVSRERAASDVGAICGRFVRDNTNAYRAGSGFTATTLNVQDEMTKDARPLLLILLGTTGLILLIACANVANLTIARLMRRDRELALRAALGANRGRLVRQLLTESTLLAVAGGAFGILFASSTVGMLTTFVGRFTTRTGEIGLDPWVLGFTLGVSVLTGLGFGTFPAMASRVDLVDAMKQGSKGAGESTGRRRVQRSLIVAQVAVSVVLLVGAGLLLASFYRLKQVDSGYRADHVLSAEVFTNFTKYPNANAQLAFYQPLIQRLQGEAGVVSVAVTNAVPLSAIQPGNNPFQIEGRADDADRRPSADVRIVSPAYFSTIGVPLVAGRVITDADKVDGLPVVVINKAMTRYWDKADPIGSRLSFDNGQHWATVVGVVGDVRQFGLSRDAAAQVYGPMSQASNGIGGARVLVRTKGDPIGAAKIIRDDVHAIDPNMPVENIRSLEDIRDGYLATPRLTAMLLSIFAALAMLVTMTGITGVIATSVSQRTQEFGVRMALGASRDRVLRMVVGQGLVLVGAGLCLGIAASLALARVLATLLFNTQPTDLITFTAVAVTFTVAGTIACLGPAWRATTVDPIQALRAD